MNIMNRIDDDKEANDKFKKPKEDPTILQEGQKLIGATDFSYM